MFWSKRISFLEKNVADISKRYEELSFVTQKLKNENLALIKKITLMEEAFKDSIINSVNFKIICDYLTMLDRLIDYIDSESNSEIIHREIVRLLNMKDLQQYEGIKMIFPRHLNHREFLSFYLNMKKKFESLLKEQRDRLDQL